jgi:hypothetical protein
MIEIMQMLLQNRVEVWSQQPVEFQSCKVFRQQRIGKKFALFFLQTYSHPAFELNNIQNPVVLKGLGVLIFSAADISTSF